MSIQGPHSVTGIVFKPDRTPAGRGIAVRLSKGANDAIAWTNDDGQYSISGVNNGTYTLSIDPWEDFEPASQRLEIALPQGAPAQIFTVDLHLRRKSSVKPGVIDAEMAQVPKKAMRHYANAIAAKEKGDHPGAAEELQRAVAEYPKFTMAHVELGVQYQELNEMERAHEHLRVALELKPGAYGPLANLGVVLARLKKYEEAESVLKEALKIKNDSAVLHFYLGRSLVGQKKLSEAEAAFRAALRVGGNQMIEAHRALANIYLQTGENKKALSELESYLAANPKPADEKKLRDTVEQIKGLLSGEKQKP